MSHVRALAVVPVVALVMAGCTEEVPPEEPVPTIVVTVDPGTLPLDGTSKATITIKGTNPDNSVLAGTVTLTLSPDVGGLSATSVTLANGTATVELTACARGANCVDGVVTITAASGNGVGFNKINYGRVGNCADGATEDCGNGADDNCNGLADCDDPGCVYRACKIEDKDCSGGACTCQVDKVCQCQLGEPDEVTCNDQKDNDCDGRKDCDDTQCEGRKCGLNLICSRGRCAAATGSGSGVTIGDVTMSISAEPTKLPADGQSKSVITVLIQQGGSPKKDVAVRFRASRDALSDGLSDVTISTNVAGQAAIDFTAPTTTGNIKVTATITAPVEAGQEISIDIIALGSIAYVGAQYPVMGVRTSGFNEQNVLTFALQDAAGLPFPDGVRVNFSHTSLAGSSISPSQGTSVGGVVRTSLYPGTSAGTVNVIATAQIGGLALTTPSDAIAIIGAKASGRNFSVACRNANIPALVDHDCSFSYTEVQSGCQVTIGDRFNNRFGRTAEVFFTPEAGLFGPPALTPAYSGSGDPNSQTGLGRVSSPLLAYGARLPRDVDVIANNASLPANEREAFDTGTDLCGRTKRNQRDGLVTVVVHTQGEEGFIDTNGNGQYDSGESFYDQGEPFVDANDNNTWDTNEVFVDTNSSGAYEPPNGVWDPDTTIWAETRVLYTGHEAYATPAPTTFTVPNKTFASFTVWYEDVFHNFPAPVAIYSAAKLAGEGFSVEQISPRNYVDSYGFAYVQPTVCTGAVCKRENRFRFFGNYNPPTSPGTPAPVTVLVKGDAATDEVPTSGSVETSVELLNIVKTRTWSVTVTP